MGECGANDFVELPALAVWTLGWSCRGHAADPAGLP
jgi:hypothetical protein